MKTRFNTYDIICMVTELQKLIGMRVNQVYDIDNKSYLIRLQRSEEKAVLLLESASRLHTTHFEWPKNVAPSGFTMKLRKHLKNKRLEKLSQLGIDRIVDLQFGSGEAAYHVILELYDRGNIVLTDYEWTILNVLRPHVEGDKVRFAVKEKYPLDRAKSNFEPPDEEGLKKILANSKPGDNLKKILNPNLEYGPAIIDHVLLEQGLTGNMKVSSDPNKGFFAERDLPKLAAAVKRAEELLASAQKEVAKGFITQKKEERPNPTGDGKDFFITNVEFHPMLYNQHQKQPYAEYDSFDRAVDEFFSALEGQKIDLKTIQVEREAMKKLQNVRKDHEKRVTELEQVQVTDRQAAELISRNEPLVEQARLAVQAAIANQMSWDDIKELVKTAQENADPVASCIKQLKLQTNHITLQLTDPYDDEDVQPMCVDIDLSLTAFANARKYYDLKRNAAKKQQKTLESADKALKSAERRTKQTLKEAQTISSISKARRTYWFEKFFWFISSDNYLVIGGRDQQQNELLVKRYMRATDIYVHAEVSGAASVIIKNPAAAPAPVPPRTLAEAGQAAVAYSVAWEAKVLTSAWWVHAHQVSKSAPTGEYLTTGSFMIRGRKNYLLPQHLANGHLQMGFSFMFRLEDSCIEKHRDERKSVIPDDASDAASLASDAVSLAPPASEQDEQDEEIAVSDDGEGTIPVTVRMRKKRTKRRVGRSPRRTKLDDIDEDSEDEAFPDTHIQGIGKTSQTHFSQHILAHPTDSTRWTDGIVRVTDNRWMQVASCRSLWRSKGEAFVQGERLLADDDDDDPRTSLEATLPKKQKKIFHTYEYCCKTCLFIQIDHGTGEVIMKSKTRTMSEVSDRSDDKPSFPALPKKTGKKQNSKEHKKDPKQEEKKEPTIKRGQRSKLKKIKEKYKDQDEEDRALMMDLLQSANTKDTKKSQKKALAKAKPGKAARGPKIPMPAPQILEAEDDDAEPEPDAEPEAEQQAGAGAGAGADAEALAQLTGCPFAEDELLFAVPVVAPYSALHNYKYKVKLTPGNSKRGKAAKTAVQVFIRDKTCSPREKDLLKAVKEENVARNFPGKVKLSAPQLHKHKK
ncbi:nuclear export mediator factor NEMF homolog Clbn [Choristoneura fumiferana]|uniref:nuclear export mediator factor NEMF homolog Clbn n=1 Tax=Choristoneura fumiferana TaxID=7141 RepID=UPI003D154760